jgi:hypothetical protein
MNQFLLALIVLLAAASVVYRYVRRRPHDTGRAIARDVLAGVAVYGLIGPLIGLLVVTFPISLPATLFSLDGVRTAYLFGAMPAVLCGVTAGAFKAARTSWRTPAWICVAGALYGFLFILSVFGAHRLGYVIDAAKAGALPGLAAAIVCTLLFYGRPRQASGPAAQGQ